MTFMKIVIPTVTCWIILMSGVSLAKGTQQPEAGSLERMRNRAAIQHELAALLLQKKEFSKAAEEALKIFEMKWPVEQEPVLLRELLFFTSQFSRQGQASVALQLIGRSERAFKTTSSRLAVCKEKGYLYKITNQMDKALECFREAQRLERTFP